MLPAPPSESPTKASQSVHGDSPRMAHGSPLTLAALRPAQSHVEAVASPVRGSTALDEIGRYPGRSCESMDSDRSALAQPDNCGVADVLVFPPDAPTALHRSTEECVLAADIASRVQVDDLSTAASQSHLDTEPESTSATFRCDDPPADAGLGAHSVQAPEDVCGSLPAIGASMACGRRQKQQSNKEARSRSHSSARSEVGHTTLHKANTTGTYRSDMSYGCIL